MHVVTKILIVCCAVLSLVLSALTMAYASNADALRQSIDSERALRLASQANLEEQSVKIDEERANLEAVNTDLRNQLTARTDEVTRLQADRTTAEQNLINETHGKESLRAELDRAVATSKAQADLLAALSAQAEKLRNDLFAASKREIQLVDRLNDLESQREVLEQTARALQEQLKEAQDSLAAAQSGAGSAGAVASTGVIEYFGKPIRAIVTEAFKGANGEDMCVINEGANGGLKDNMMMHVTRSGQFVASIVIVKADAQQSICRVEKYGRDVQVLAQDIAVTLAAQ